MIHDDRFVVPDFWDLGELLGWIVDRSRRSGMDSFSEDNHGDHHIFLPLQNIETTIGREKIESEMGEGAAFLRRGMTASSEVHLLEPPT